MSSLITADEANYGLGTHSCDYVVFSLLDRHCLHLSVRKDSTVIFMDGRERLTEDKWPANLTTAKCLTRSLGRSPLSHLHNVEHICC